jgi:hypothetical protein
MVAVASTAWELFGIFYSPPKTKTITNYVHYHKIFYVEPKYRWSSCDLRQDQYFSNNITKIPIHQFTFSSNMWGNLPYGLIFRSAIFEGDYFQYASNLMSSVVFFMSLELRECFVSTHLKTYLELQMVQCLNEIQLCYNYRSGIYLLIETPVYITIENKINNLPTA